MTMFDDIEQDDEWSCPEGPDEPVDPVEYARAEDADHQGVEDE